MNVSRPVRVIIGLGLGFFVGVILGALGVWLFSSNTHDRSLEIAMTSVFFSGPIGAVIGLLVGLFK